MDMGPDSVGRRIAHRRQQLGWTQQELARRCGVNVITVSKWERGVVMPARKIVKLEEALLAPAAWILTGTLNLQLSAKQIGEAKHACRRLLNDARKLLATLESANVPKGESKPVKRAWLEKIYSAIHFIETECKYMQNYLPQTALGLSPKDSD
jgi:transcriptional regulator with XRE-family HTH domain